MRRITPFAALPSLAAVTALGAYSADAADLTPLQALAGATKTYVYGISADGLTLVGHSYNSNDNPTAVSWNGSGTPTCLVNVNCLPFGTASAVNFNGTAIGIADGGGGGIIHNGTFYATWDKNGNGVHPTLIHGITDDGLVAVGGSGNEAAYWYWNGVGNVYSNAQILPGYVINGQGEARGVDGAGISVVGWSTTSGGLHHASYWEAFATIHDLDAAGTGDSEAYAISHDGSTIVGYTTVGGIWHATSWSGAGFATATDFGATITSDHSWATAINGDGTVIGGNYYTGGVQSSFLYSTTTSQGGDLKTLLSAAGVNVSGITLNNLTGISGDGKYIAVNDDTAYKAYLAYYDGTIAGLSNGPAQQASLDDLQQTRQSIAIQQDAFAGLMTGDLDRQKSGAELGVFGLYGSAMGGLRGRAGLGDSIVLSAGLAGGTGDHDALSYKGLMGAAALRYDFLPLASGWRAFGQVGGAFGQLNDLSFARTYANGAGSATGIGNTSGQIASLHARLGLTGDLSPQTQVQIAAELGERWLSVDGYAETLSVGNPFPATVADGTDRQTVAKIIASWTQGIGDRGEITLRGAVGTSLEGASGLKATVPGFGTFTAEMEAATWAEAGLRVGYRVADRVTVDGYATGIAGRQTGTAGHVGAGVRIGF